MRMAIVAGEPSGDLLGADLIRALKSRRPDLSFVGIGGPAMQAEGLESLFPMEALSVMGLVEVVQELPRLLKIRHELSRRFLAERPTCFIGIDSPDFNLGLARRLRAGGIPTVHYVSPSVWAWRQGRIKGIAESVELMLTLFPFEVDFYREHGVHAVHVGHPAADRLPLEVDPGECRRRLGVTGEAPVVALLPGSRRGELARLGGVFAEAAAAVRRQIPECRFLAPMVNTERREQFLAQLTAADVAEAVTLIDGQADLAMAASDCVLLASGTATLEAMLLKRPMVVGYKVAPLTAALVRALRLVKIRRFALPNLLAGEELVPEYIQEQAEPGALAAAVVALLEDAPRRERLSARFRQMHESLRRGASARAAEAILECLD